MAALIRLCKRATSRGRDSTFAIMSKPIARQDWPKASFGQSERFASLLQQTSQRPRFSTSKLAFQTASLVLLQIKRRRTRGL